MKSRLNVHRVKPNPGSSIGWQVRIRHRNVLVGNRFFSDAAHGGCHAALAKALRLRNQVFRQIGRAVPAHA
jgi:hypothetical protein